MNQPTFSSTVAPRHTPWGAPQHSRELVPGIWTVSTAGHGGLWLSPERLALMPASCQSTPYSSGGWFEEDCDALLVYARFPEALGDSNWDVAQIKLALSRSKDYFGAQRLADLGVEVAR